MAADALHRARHALLTALARTPAGGQLVLRGRLLLDQWLGQVTAPAGLVELAAPAGLESATLQEALREAGDGQEPGEARPLGDRPGWRWEIGAGRRGQVTVVVESGASLAPSPQPAIVTGPRGMEPVRMLGIVRDTAAAEAFVALARARDSLARPLLDLWWLAGRFGFDGATLGQALETAFRARCEPLPAPVDGDLRARLEAVDEGELAEEFERRREPGETLDSRAVRELPRRFLELPLETLGRGLPPAMAWPPGGPWGRTGYWRYG